MVKSAPSELPEPVTTWWTSLMITSGPGGVLGGDSKGFCGTKASRSGRSRGPVGETLPSHIASTAALLSASCG